MNGRDKHTDGIKNVNRRIIDVRALEVRTKDEHLDDAGIYDPRAVPLKKLRDPRYNYKQIIGRFLIHPCETMIRAHKEATMKDRGQLALLIPTITVRDVNGKHLINACYVEMNGPVTVDVDSERKDAYVALNFFGTLTVAWSKEGGFWHNYFDYENPKSPSNPRMRRS